MKYRLIVSACLLTTTLFGQSPGPVDYLGYAQSFYSVRQLDSASYYARKNIISAQQSQQWNEQAYGLSWLGDTYRREEQYDSAFYYLSRALATVASSPVQDTTRATTYYQFGVYYKETRQPAQALQMYEQALEISNRLGDSVSLANTYNALASVHRYTYFDYITAERYYQQALRLLESSDETKKLFDVLYNLATTHRLKGDYDEALAYGYRATTLAQDLKGSNQEVCFTMLGNIYDDKEDLRSAIANYQQALALGVARLGNDDPSLMVRYNNLAAVYIKADSIPLGVELLSRSLQIYRLTPQAGKENDLADTYEFLGNAYSKQGQLDSASHSYHQSLRINRNFNGFKHPLTSHILATIGEFQRQQHFYDSALYYIQQSLMADVPNFDQPDIREQPTVTMMRDNPLNFKLLYQKAVVLLDKYQQSSDTRWLSPALTCFARADSLIDSCRVLYDREAAKLSFLGENKKVYEAAVACAYALYQTTPNERYLSWAFRFMEKSKAVVLWESLADSQIKSGVGIPDSLLEVERSLNVKLAYTNNELYTASQHDSTAVSVANLRAEQYALTRQREDFTQLLRRRYPRYFQIKYGNTPFTLAQAQDYTQSPTTHLVEYLWGSQYIYALSISPQQVLFDRLPLTDTIRQSLSTVLQSLQHPPYLTQSQRDFQLYTTAAYHLYQQLLQPLMSPEGNRLPEDEGSGLYHSVQEAQRQVYTTKVTIIPDGPLSYLPFEALLTDLPSSPAPDYRHLPYVLDTYSVSYAQSAQVLTQRSMPKNKVRNAMRFLAFGYASQPSSPDVVSRSAPTWQDLPGTTQEIEALGQMAEGTFYLGEGATESRFKAEAKHYDVIHLAVHGLADTLNPNNSRLVFRGEQDSIDDGLLYSYELYDLQLQADLAVLSACESGTGRWLQGEGVYSLARGFTYAGCPTVVMSLWKVDDQQTSAIMPAFYRSLYQGLPVDQALRTAKIQYRQHCHRFFAHPAFWSAFVVEGNTFPIVSYQATYYAAWLIFSLSIVYLSLTLYRAWKIRRKNHQSFVKANWM